MQIKAAAHAKFDAIKQGITNKINAVKEAVQNAINKIKSIMKFSWKLPHLKLSHISISGSFSLSPPSVPKFGLSWFAKGGILTQPTVFGANGNNLMAGGEARKEAVLPLNAETLGGIGRGIANATGFGNMANIEALLKRLIASNERPVVVMLPNGQVIFESIKNYSDQWTSSTVDWTERGLTI
ncbi:hypothetical protein HZY91_02940 [Facklamia sp. DSM 111018]|uniref:Uncharacterized protein n=2 Tax=Facklamia lactis TaxID=2749967 RepID=A0ABS0LPE5_9LACT|nr:hypothetical protein [Facklamia lactis]